MRENAARENAARENAARENAAVIAMLIVIGALTSAVAGWKPTWVAAFALLVIACFTLIRKLSPKPASR